MMSTVQSHSAHEAVVEAKSRGENYRLLQEEIAACTTPRDCGDGYTLDDLRYSLDLERYRLLEIENAMNQVRLVNRELAFTFE
jgi:hypothetical protein